MCSIWLKIKQEGQTAGFGPCLHLPQVLVHVSTYQGKPFWDSGVLSHSHLQLAACLFCLHVQPGPRALVFRYEKRFGPWFTEPIVAGLDKDHKPQRPRHGEASLSTKPACLLVTFSCLQGRCTKRAKVLVWLRLHRMSLHRSGASLTAVLSRATGPCQPVVAFHLHFETYGVFESQRKSQKKQAPPTKSAPPTAPNRPPPPPVPLCFGGVFVTRGRRTVGLRGLRHHLGPALWGLRVLLATGRLPRRRGDVVTVSPVGIWTTGLTNVDEALNKQQHGGRILAREPAWSHTGTDSLFFSFL